MISQEVILKTISKWFFITQIPWIYRKEV